ncbi:MAG: hypothetical protein ACK5OX_09175 [Desertimonas sp.]
MSGGTPKLDPLPPLAVVDIDGVVADVRHRLHFVERRPKDWDGFFGAAASDPAHPEGLAVVARLAEDHDIVFLTGRPSRLRDVTQAWLDRHRLGGHALHMRSERDRAPARVVKPAVLARLAAGRTVGVVVDDDPDVLTAMASRGWPTFLADWERRDQAATDALHDAQQTDGRT